MLTREINMADMLNGTAERNPDLISQSIDLHQSLIIPPDTFVIDLDAVESISKVMVKEAKRNGNNLCINRLMQDVRCHSIISNS